MPSLLRFPRFISALAGIAAVTACGGSGGDGGGIVGPPPAAPVASVAVTPPSATVVLGYTTQLTATPKDAAGNALTDRTVAWSSSDTTVATVNGTGLVTSRKAGTATVTATSEGKPGTAVITVSRPPVAQVIVSPTSVTLKVGESVTLVVTLKDSQGNVLTGRSILVSYNSAYVTDSGLTITGKAAGNTSVTIISAEENVSTTVPVTVTP